MVVIGKAASSSGVATTKVAPAAPSKSKAAPAKPAAPKKPKAVKLATSSTAGFDSKPISVFWPRDARGQRCDSTIAGETRLYEVLTMITSFVAMHVFDAGTLPYKKAVDAALRHSVAAVHALRAARTSAGADADFKAVLAQISDATLQSKFAKCESYAAALALAKRKPRIQIPDAAIVASAVAIANDFGLPDDENIELLDEMSKRATELLCAINAAKTEKSGESGSAVARLVASGQFADELLFQKSMLKLLRIHADTTGASQVPTERAALAASALVVVLAKKFAKQLQMWHASQPAGPNDAPVAIDVAQVNDALYAVFGTACAGTLQKVVDITSTRQAMAALQGGM